MSNSTSQSDESRNGTAQRSVAKSENLTRRHLFLDLEDTVITPVVEGWFKTELINVDKVRGIIAEFKPHFVHLFSFAVWNKDELFKFDQGTRPMLEKALGVKFCTTWTVDDDILPQCCEMTTINSKTIDFSDMSAFWGKHEAFRLCMRHTFGKTHNHSGIDVDVMLLDDVVINETFAWPDLKIRGHILNIDNLPEPWNALNRPNHS